ncbi:transcriptional regulator [Aureimonas sp. ME7]|uniref:3'-5' exonuclease n=1 Tax=Aureimonas sp. ME7 TaxID=2744252 RepID=UPI0015F5CDAB|nr:transcriptional regulator [Aureimonas sp. ME7]
MDVFLNFEASSLAKGSYPIEVAWVFEDGAGESHLIRPADGWTDWDEGAAAIHGISRAELLETGTAHDEVARRMVAALSGHALYASAPSWDGKWLSVLLRAAGLPRHALRLRDTEDARTQAVACHLGPERVEEARALLEEIEDQARKAVPAHRALADAERERQLWLEATRRAKAMA